MKNKFLFLIPALLVFASSASFGDEPPRPSRLRRAVCTDKFSGKQVLEMVTNSQATSGETDQYFITAKEGPFGNDRDTTRADFTFDLAAKTGYKARLNDRLWVNSAHWPEAAHGEPDHTPPILYEPRGYFFLQLRPNEFQYDRCQWCADASWDQRTGSDLSGGRTRIDVYNSEYKTDFASLEVYQPNNLHRELTVTMKTDELPTVIGVKCVIDWLW